MKEMTMMDLITGLGILGLITAAKERINRNKPVNRPVKNYYQNIAPVNSGKIVDRKRYQRDIEWFGTERANEMARQGFYTYIKY